MAVTNQVTNAVTGNAGGNMGPDRLLGIRDQGSGTRDPGSGVGFGFAGGGQNPPLPDPNPGPRDLVLGHLEARGYPRGQDWNPTRLHERLLACTPETVCAVLDLGMATLPEQQRRADVILGRKFHELLAKLPPPKPPAARMACHGCHGVFDVDASGLLPAYHEGCDASAGDEARRRAAAGDVSWRPHGTGVQG